MMHVHTQHHSHYRAHELLTLRLVTPCIAAGAGRRAPGPRDGRRGQRAEPAAPRAAAAQRDLGGRPAAVRCVASQPPAAGVAAAGRRPRLASGRQQAPASCAVPSNPVHVCRLRVA